MTNNLHNNPPSDAQIFQDRLASLTAQIAEVTEVKDDEQEKIAADLVNVARDLAKEADAKRAELKAPILAEGREIDGAFKPIVDGAKDATKPLRVLMAAHIREKQRKALEEERKAREEAERKAAEAEVLGDDDLVGEIVKEEAIEAQTAAAVAGINTKKAGQAKPTGGRAMSVRKTYGVTVTDSAALVEHFKKTQAVIDLCAELATRQVRAMKGDIELPGIEITTTESVQ